MRPEVGHLHVLLCPEGEVGQAQRVKSVGNLPSYSVRICRKYYTVKPSESEQEKMFTFHDLSYILCNRMEILGPRKSVHILEVFTCWRCSLLEVLLYLQMQLNQCEFARSFKRYATQNS